MSGTALLSTFTYIPILAREYLGADELYVTLLVASYATTAFVSSFIFGRAGDIYDRRLILRVGLAFSAISVGCMVFASSPEILFLVRTVNGFCIGLYPGTLAAYAYESKMKMGRFATFGAIGYGTGTIIAGYVAGFGIRNAFLVISVLLVFAFITSLTLPSIPRVSLKVPWFPVETFRRNKSIYAAFFIRHSSASAIWTLWPLFLADLGGDYLMIGIVQATNTFTQVIVMFAIGDRLDYDTLITIGLLSSVIAFSYYVFVTEIIAILPAQMIMGCAWSCLYVGSLKHLTERNEERSTAAGLLSAIKSISAIVGPMIVMIFYILWSSYLPILLNGAFMSGVAFILYKYSSREKEICQDNLPHKQLYNVMETKLLWWVTGFGC
jgi:MFS family permease